MSRRALGANTLLSFRQINQSSLNFDELCLQATKRLFAEKLTKFQVIKKKCLIGLQDSYQGGLVLFDVHLYDEFHVPDVLIVLLYM